MWRRWLLHVVVLRVLCCGVRQQLEVDNGAVVGGSERERAAVDAGLGQPDEGLSAAAGGAVEVQLGIWQITRELDKLRGRARVGGEERVEGGAADELVVAGGRCSHDKELGTVAAAGSDVNTLDLDATNWGGGIASRPHLSVVLHKTRLGARESITVLHWPWRVSPGGSSSPCRPQASLS